MDPYFKSKQAVIFLGDCREVMATLPESYFDAIVTDPPYELKFMGKGWDGSGVAYDPKVWKAALRVLKPGGHMLAFGGTRTYHRMAVAIEDAGFEIRDSLMWLYGSGFPKSLDVSKAIDKAAGAEREAIGEGPYAARRPRGIKQGTTFADDAYEWGTGHQITAPSTSEAAQWEGWGTALKPAFEIVVVGTKPVDSVTIDASLYKIEVDLWSLLSASDVVLPSQSNPNVFDVGLFDGARWSADGSISTSDVSSDRTDTLPSALAMSMCWNTVRSWRRILVGLSEAMSMSTTEILSSLTTDLKILYSSVVQLTAMNMLQNVMKERGLTPPVYPAVTCFADVAEKLQAIRILSAPAGATSSEHISLPVEGVHSPAFEPIVLARKPLAEKTVAANVLKYGTGALNVDGTRLDGIPPSVPQPDLKQVRGRATHLDAFARNGDMSASSGRWPANVLLDEEAAAMLDEQTGELISNSTGKSFRRLADKDRNAYRQFEGQTDVPGYKGDSGGASRFFYTAKASKREREEGLQDLESEQSQAVKLSEWVKEVLEAVRRGDTALFLRKATEGSVTTGDNEWSTTSSGSESEGLSPPDSKSTTSTETSSTTESKISEPLIPSRTNDFIQDALLKLESGSSPAVCAASVSRLAEKIGTSVEKAGLSMADAARVISEQLCALSEKGGMPISRMSDRRNTHPT